MEKKGQADNPFSQLGLALANSVLNSMIDSIVSPESIVTMMDKGKLSPTKKKAANTPAAESPPFDMAFDYSGWDRVVAYRSDQPDGIRLILRREGVWSWKVVSIKFPPPAKQVKK